MRAPATSIVLALGACGALGLEPTALAVDGDGDGVFDAADNCPDVPNADQADADHNGVGDACEFCRIGVDLDRDGIDDGCDACPRGRNDEDEDGDGVADACDPCPASALARGAPGEPDGDGDGIPDACDLPNVAGTVPTQRRFFDGFDRDIPAWTAPQPWVVDGGARVSTPTDLRLYAVTFPEKLARVWSVEVGLDLPPDPQPANTPTSVGLVLPIVNGFAAQFCGLVAVKADVWQLAIFDQDKGTQTTDPSPTTYAPGASVVLRAAYDVVGGVPVLACGIGADTFTAPIAAGDLHTLALRATTPTPTRFRYADILAP